MKSEFIDLPFPMGEPIAVRRLEAGMAVGLVMIGSDWYYFDTEAQPFSTSVRFFEVETLELRFSAEPVGVKFIIDVGAKVFAIAKANPDDAALRAACREFRHELGSRSTG